MRGVGLREQTVRGASSYEDACDRHADGTGRRALVWEPEDGAAETYSFDDLRRLSARMAGGLRALGVEAGARVALMLPQTPEHAIAHLASFKLGAVSVPLSRLFGPDALRYRLGDSGARVLLTESEHWAKVAGIWDDLPELRHVVLCDRRPAHTTSSR